MDATCSLEQAGGGCMNAACSLQQAGGNRTAMLMPRFGGKQRKQTTQTGKGCCQQQPTMPLPTGIVPSQELLRGGGCGCGGTTLPSPWRGLTGGKTTRGGACPCQAVSSHVPVALGGYEQAKRRTSRAVPRGGYKPTKRNLKYLKKWKQGKSIGFTMRSSLKAKGLIPRANGTYRVSAKYQHTK
jgi:hypothetical protein